MINLKKSHSKQSVLMENLEKIRRATVFWKEDMALNNKFENRVGFKMTHMQAVSSEVLSKQCLNLGVTVF